MNRSKLLSSEVVYKGFFNLRKDLLTIDDKHFDYLSIDTVSDAVLILPITPEGNYVLTLEYRYSVQKTLLSVPGGYIDEHESFEETAARELLEETGYSAEHYRLIGSAYPYAGISSQKLYYVAADNAVLKSTPKREVSEQIEIIRISPATLKEKILGGFPLDGNLSTILYFHSIWKL